MLLCELCGKCFSHQKDLNKHIRIVHLKVGKTSCKVCGKTMRKDNMKIHLRSHIKNTKQRKILLCEFCGGCFNTKIEFNSHQRRTHFKKAQLNKSKPERKNKTKNELTKHCDACLIEVPSNQWQYHLRTTSHKMKAAVIHEEGFKVVKSSFNERIETIIFENKDISCLSPKQFLNLLEKKAITELTAHLIKHKMIKFNLELFAEYIKMVETTEEMSIKSFQTKMSTIINESQLLDSLKKMIDEIQSKMDEFQQRNSGWALIAILHLEMNINRYQPLKGSSYISSPKELINKKACINIVNQDEYCFKWAIISALYSPHRNLNVRRISSYPIDDINADNILIGNININFGGLSFPLQISDISVFERNNDISINVFGWENNEVVGPFYCTQNEKHIHLNLLLLQDELNNKSHFVWIKNISRILRKQITQNHRKIFICNCCLIHFPTEERLANHKPECNKIITTMPTDENCKLYFTKYERGFEVPFVIYADFECILQNISTCLPQTSSSSTTDVQQHIPCAFAYYIKCSYDNSLNKMQIYQGMDSPKKFVHYLISDVLNIYHNIIMKPKPMKPLTEEEKIRQRDSKNCHICNKILEMDRVIDHCHLTGKYRGPAHNSCNLRFRITKFFPIFFHNFSGYDCHLFVKLLNEIEGEIKLIPINKELYVSLSKRIHVNDTDTIELRFLDSARFMQSSLDKLTQNLTNQDFYCLKANFKDNEEFELVKRKGVFPYEYINSWAQLNETELPTQANFNNKLTNKQCTDEDYQHAKKVWKKFNCVNLWSYLKIYLITDVLLLTDIFENFRKICYKIYELDPCQYFTTPGLTWDAMLKHTGIQLELLRDIDMYNFIKRGIRGGLTQCSHRHTLANNKYMPEYDKTKPSRYLVYIDVNNLYGCAMSQPLPYGEFEWVYDVDHIDIMNISENSDIGYIFEVDLEYPKILHDIHNDLPFCPENKLTPNSKYSKLIADLSNKKKYPIHYRNLQQCLQNGMKLIKIHRALKFKQSCWFKKYIDLNTYHRQQATNDFQKDFFKSMNNASYGKTMENVDKRKDVRIVTQWESYKRRLGARALIAKPNFHSACQFTPDMVAIQLDRIRTCYNKPIYLGFVILELSKWLMYDFHYNYMKPKYNQNMILNYMDTDSFIYTINTEDFYADIKHDIEARFDTSEYSPNNQYNIPLRNKKKLGMMKDENKGLIMKEFIGLRSKMYSTSVINGKVTKKAKGIKRTAVDNLSLDNYRDCLYKRKIFYSNMLVFRTKIHNIYTQHINKVSLNYLDDKRFIREDGISTYAWEHYRIK